MGLAFGSGVLVATPQGGSPIHLGILQDVSIDESVQLKRLYGATNYPVAIAAGERALTGKAKFARLSPQAVGQLVHGVQPQVGTQYLMYGEAVPTGGASPYASANAANWSEDLGVIYAATGLPLQLITGAGAPAAGQYKVAAGSYTFAAADILAGLLVNYAYAVPASGRTVAVNQALQGPLTTFSARLFQTDPQTGLFYGVKLYSCISSKLTHGGKVGDWTIPEFDFEASANAAGQVMQKFFSDNF